jgi:hypothetical protein
VRKMDSVHEKRMKTIKKAQEDYQRNRQIAMDVVDFLATKELAITDVKMILNKAYLYAKDKAVLK